MYVTFSICRRNSLLKRLLPHLAKIEAFNLYFDL